MRILLVCLLACSASAAAGEPEKEQPLLRCGSHSLYVALQLFEKGPDSFKALETQLGQPSDLGYSMEQIKLAAEKNDLQTLALSTSIENLRARDEQFACMAHVNGNHFVLLGEITDTDVMIVDAPTAYRLPLPTFASQWNGSVLLMSNSTLATELSIGNKVWWAKFRTWLMWIVGCIGATGCCWLIWSRRTS